MEKIEEDEEIEESPKMVEIKSWLPTTLIAGITVALTLWILFFYGLLDLQIPLTYLMGFPVVLGVCG